jgi:hypothetical protein
MSLVRPAVWDELIIMGPGYHVTLLQSVGCPNDEFAELVAAGIE